MASSGDPARFQFCGVVVDARKPPAEWFSEAASNALISFVEWDAGTGFEPVTFRL